MEPIDNEIKQKLSYFQSGYEDRFDEEDEHPEDNLDIIGDVMDYSITSKVTGLQLESIINSLKTGYFIVPGFQRKFIWKKNQIAALALSVIKHVPIPPFYVYVDNKTKKQVILDGQQRVTAIFLYIYGLYFVNESKREIVKFIEVAKLKEEIDRIDFTLKSLEGKEKTTKSNNVIKEKKKEKDKLYKILRNDHNLVETNYCIMDQYKTQKNISFSSFDYDSQQFLLRHDFQVAVVRCTNKQPQKVYANIFKVLNTGGKILGSQEIRNGVYWESYLYTRLNEINNQEVSVWRTIYGKISDYSKDIEILLKMLALNHYTIVNNNKVEIEYNGTFNWRNIMESYSEECQKLPNEEVEKDIAKLLLYLDKIEFENDIKKCNKAAFEAVFVALCLTGMIDQVSEIKISWIIHLEKDTIIFDKVLSTKESVIKRLQGTKDEVQKVYAGCN